MRTAMGQYPSMSSKDWSILQSRQFSLRKVQVKPKQWQEREYRWFRVIHLFVLCSDVLFEVLFSCLKEASLTTLFANSQEARKNPIESFFKNHLLNEMSEEKFGSISIKDSPIGLSKNTFVYDYSMEKSLLVEERADQSHFRTQVQRLKEYDTYGKNKDRILKLTGVYVNDVCVGELAELSSENISVQNLERLLQNLEESRLYWDEIVSEMTNQGEIPKIPDFTTFEKLNIPFYNNIPIDVQPKIKVKLEIEEEKQGKQVNKDHNVSNNQRTLYSDQLKLMIVRLWKYYRVMKRKIDKFLKTQREIHNRIKPLFCKFCGLTFQSGRQMGGHISRMHKGMSISFKKKCLSRIINNEQKNRRLHWKKARQRMRIEESAEEQAEYEEHEEVFHTPEQVSNIVESKKEDKNQKIKLKRQNRMEEEK